jgi:hypothetical protein
MVSSCLSPQEDVGSNFIMTKMVTFNGGKRGQMQKQKPLKGLI